MALESPQPPTEERPSFAPCARRPTRPEGLRPASRVLTLGASGVGVHSPGSSCSDPAAGLAVPARAGSKHGVAEGARAARRGSGLGRRGEAEGRGPKRPPPADRRRSGRVAAAPEKPLAPASQTSRRHAGPRRSAARVAVFGHEAAPPAAATLGPRPSRPDVARTGRASARPARPTAVNAAPVERTAVGVGLERPRATDGAWEGWAEVRAQETRTGAHPVGAPGGLEPDVGAVEGV